MNVAVVSHFGPGYSGGRLHAWFLVEALAAKGHDVTVYADRMPDFREEFGYLPGHDSIRDVVAPHFSFEISDEHDAILLIPDLVGHWNMYHKVISHVRRTGCKLILMSYETPNWKHLEQSTEHSISEEYGSLEAGRVADVILANSKLSSEMSRDFFTDTKAVFDYACPPVHTHYADLAPESEENRKRILIISRFTPRYKNSHRFVEILSPDCEGYEFIFMENGLMSRATIEAYTAACRSVGASFKLVGSVTEMEKFELIKSCSLMVYPSTFEGYGLPPVESLYCGVPCVAFALPVLEQVHGDDLIYAKKGDFADFRQVLSKTLQTLGNHEVDTGNLNCHPDFEYFADKVDRIVGGLEVRNG